MRENNSLDDYPLVSIVTPAYNREKFILETIESVRCQTYQNWELLIIDDISTDKTADIVRSVIMQDSRVKFFTLPEKGGASVARNCAIEHAMGKYIAFLDSDDVWMPNKLEKQVEFMEKNNYVFTYHNYELMDECSQSLKKMRIAPKKMTYRKQLIGCSIGCLSVMYNAERVGNIQIRRIDKRNDDALWIEILKKCRRGYLLGESLAVYRISNISLSSGSKWKLLKYHYQLYRVSQEFNVIKSMFLTFTNIIVYFYNKKRREISI